MFRYLELGDYCEIAAEILGLDPERLARNHPLPDGNKRAAFLSVWLFVEMNDRPFAGEDPDVDVPMMERIAAGESGGDEIAQWLAKRTAPSG